MVHKAVDPDNQYIKAGAPRRLQGDLVTILWPVTSKGKARPQYHMDLGERECAAIGYATVHWSFLEEAVFKRTEAFCKRAKVRVPEDAKAISFSRRIGALREMYQATVKDAARRRWWELLISQIGKENGIRQKIIHGLWSYDPANPERLFSSPGSSKDGRSTPFNVDKLFEFGERAGELAFALLHPMPKAGRPRKDGNIAFAYASRAFLLTLAGKADALGFPRSTPITSTPPLTPSQESRLKALMTKAS